MEPASSLAALLSTELSIEQCPLIVNVATTLASVIQQMCQCSSEDKALGRSCGRSSYALVMDNQQLVGILTESDVVRLTATGVGFSATAVGDVMTRNLITINAQELRHPMSVVQVLQQKKIRHLPVLDDQGHLLGVITPETIRQSLQARDLLRLRRISEVIVTEVLTAPPEFSMRAIVQHMMEQKASCIVICEAHLQAPIGIITEYDIVQLQNLQLDLQQLTAADVMSAPLVTVSSDSSLWDVHCQMQSLRIQRMVVADAGQLTGMITQHAILSGIDPMEMYSTISLLQKEVQQLRDERLNITTRANQQLNQQLISTEQRLQGVFKQSARFTILLDQVGNLLDINQAVQQLTGTIPQTVLGQPIWELPWWSTPATQSELIEVVAKVRRGAHWQKEIPVHGQDGQPIYLELYLRPVFDDNGTVTLIVGEGTDRTAVKAAQESLLFQQAFDRLIANISMRFAYLEPHQLTQSIEQSLQQIGTFLSVDVGCVVKLIDNRQQLELAHAWTADGHVVNWEQQLLDLELEQLAWSMGQVLRGELLAISDMAQVPEEGQADAVLWQAMDWHGLIILPLLEERQVIGWVAWATRKPQTNWSEETLRLLRIFAAILSSSLQRQHAEQAFIATQKEYAKLIDRVEVGVYHLCSGDGTSFRYEQVSQRWCDQLGLDADAVLSDATVMFRHVHPDDLGDLMWAYEQSFLNATPLYWEGRFVRNECIRWIRLEATPSHQDTGNVSWSGLQYDVTDVRIAQNVPGYIYLERNDQEYTPEYVSPGVEAITGYQASEYVIDRSVTCNQLLHPDDRESVWQIIQIAVAAQQPYELEYRIFTKSGELKWIWERGQAIYAEDGSVMYLKGFVMDITDRKTFKLPPLNRQMA